MMKQIRTLAAAAALSALCAMPAQAAGKLTDVTGDYYATNGCTVRSVYGYGGYGFNVVIWGVTCPGRSEVTVERVDYWTDWGYNWCEMRNASSGYSVSGQCGNYTIWWL